MTKLIDKEKLTAITQIFRACQSLWKKLGPDASGKLVFVVSGSRSNNPSQADKNFILNAIQLIARGDFCGADSPCLKVGTAARHASLIKTAAKPDAELLHTLEQEGLENEPVIDVSLDDGNAMIYFDGLGAETGLHIWSLADQPLTLDDCNKLLAQFHSTFTACPRVDTVRYWVKAADWSVVPYLEATIQRDLIVFLRGKLSEENDCHATAEAKTETGRCDIKITQCDNGRTVAIEMKAVRDRVRRGQKAEPHKWDSSKSQAELEKGFQQAAGYATDPTVTHAILAVWNASEDVHEIWRAELEADSKKAGIGFQWFRMFPTQDLWRKANLPSISLTSSG